VVEVPKHTAIPTEILTERSLMENCQNRSRLDAAAQYVDPIWVSGDFLE
jgi:hypothetical protein